MTFPAAFAGVLFGLVATAATGFAIVRFVARDLTRAELAAWSFATGLLVQSLLYAAAVSILPGSGRTSVLVLDVAIVAASMFAKRPRGPIAPPVVRPSAIAVTLGVIAGAAWLVFFVQAVSEPMWATDYLAMWGLKAKTIFETGFVPRRLFQDPALDWGRPDHPLLVPLALAALASLSGGWNDQALALLFPVCGLATIVAVWGFLARRVSPLAGASAAALVSLCFPLYRPVHAGLAEIPLAFAMVLASCAFFDALDVRSRPAMARLFLASLLCAWTKPEGALFVLLLAAVLWFRRRARPVDTWKSGGWALVVPPVVHSSLMFLLCRPRPQRDFDPTFLEPRRWAELLARLGTVIARIVAMEGILVWVAVLAIALFFVVTRRGLADSLLAVFALQILAYVAAFAISSHDPIWKVDSCFQRIVATLFPAFALVLGSRVAGEEAGRTTPPAG